MKIAGIDYSMTCPAVCIFEGDEFSFNNCEFFYRIDNKKYTKVYKTIHGTEIQTYTTEIERYYNHAKWALDLVKTCSIVAIEGYSMGSKGKVFNIAENCAILKYLLYQHSIPFTSIPPTNIKKYVIKGNADKELLYDCFIKETKINLKKKLGYTAKNIGSPISDIVDSYYITKYLFYNGVKNV